MCKKVAWQDLCYIFSLSQYNKSLLFCVVQFYTMHHGKRNLPGPEQLSSAQLGHCSRAAKLCLAVLYCASVHAMVDAI